MDSSDVNDLLIFMAVIEAGSFVAGGKTLGLSRSAAGKAVARLEKRFSVRLLNRSTRALHLTEEGRLLYAHAGAIRDAMDALERRLEPDSGYPRGVLRLAVPDAFGRKLVLPVVGRYLEAWPEVQLEMSFSDRISNIVEDGFDLAIRIGVTDPNPGLISRTIMRDELLLCAAPAYLARKGVPATAEQLSTHELLFHASHNERLNWHLREQDGQWMRAQGRSRLRLDSGEALRDAALAGMGIALLPRFLVGEDITAGRLRHLLPSGSPGSVPIVALYPHKRHLEAKVRRFIDLLVETLSKANRHSYAPDT